MEQPLPKLEPLVDTLKNLELGDFLKSRDFKKYCIEVKLENNWRDIYDYVKISRTYYSVGRDYEKLDSINAFIILLNNLYERGGKNFFYFVAVFIRKYKFWIQKEMDTTDIADDLEQLFCPLEIVEEIKAIGEKSKPVPAYPVTELIQNHKRLEECVIKMDRSIFNKDYNLTLTYAYSSLEGIFKAYVHQEMPLEKDVSDLAKLAKLVKDHIKNKFMGDEKEYPEQIINLIGTITNAVSSARNSFSDSHFDKDAEKWLAEFAKDCVNAIGRLVVSFIISESKPGS